MTLDRESISWKVKIMQIISGLSCLKINFSFFPDMKCPALNQNAEQRLALLLTLTCLFELGGVDGTPASSSTIT